MTHHQKQGFTIIEVSLVLAIAGLIFLMVFVALPALQRSTRDTKRRENMMHLLSQIKKYQTNNRGALPTGVKNNITYNSAINETTTSTWAGFYKNYLNANFTDPSSGENYVLNISNCNATNNTDCREQYKNRDFPNGNNIAIILNATCDGETAIKSNNPRKIAVLYKLELGTYCGNT